MSTNDHTQFDTWLDAFVAGRSTPASRAASDPETAGMRDAARQFHGLARHAEQTSADRSLSTSWEDFMHAHAPETSRTDAFNTGRHKVGPYGTSARPGPMGLANGTRESQRFPWNRVANVLLAAALILAISAGIWRATSGFDGPGEGGNQPAAFAPETSVFTPASPDATPTSWGGNNGHTSFTADAGFDTSTYSTSTVIDDSRYTIRAMQVSGNLLVQTGEYTEGEYGDAHTSMMWATDLTTGEVRWTLNQAFAPGFAIAAETIYALHIAQNVEEPYLSMAAIDLATGERRTFEETRLPVIESGEQIGPIVVGDLVYVADSVGTTFALDAATGKVIWTTEGDRGDTPAPSREGPGATGGALTTDGESIYVVTGANKVRKLDANTGEILFDASVSESLPEEFGDDIFGVALYFANDRLIVRVTGYPATGSDDGAIQMIPESILLMDRGNGEAKWLTLHSDIAGEIAIASDYIFIPIRLDQTDRIDLQVLFLRNRESMVYEDVLSARTVAITATGAVGNNLILVDSDGNLMTATHSIDGQNWSDGLDLVTIRSIPGESQVLQPVISDGVAYVVNGVGGIMAITPDRGATETTGSATPDGTATLPTAEDCTVQPLTIDQVLWYMDDPIAAGQSREMEPAATPDMRPGSTPSAEVASGIDDPGALQEETAPDPLAPTSFPGFDAGPASPAQLAAIADVQWMWMACALADSPFQRWALESPSLVAEQVMALLPNFANEDDARQILEEVEATGELTPSGDFWNRPNASFVMITSQGFPSLGTIALVEPETAPSWTTDGHNFAVGYTSYDMESQRALHTTELVTTQGTETPVIDPADPRPEFNRCSSFELTWFPDRDELLISRYPACG